MVGYYARYELENGFIHNWIVAGPQTIPVLDLEKFRGDDWKLQIARHYYEKDSGVTQAPVENQPFQISEVSETSEILWDYNRCDDDHFVDRTAFYHTCHYLKSWAYSRVVVPAAQAVQCVLTTNGPADVWINGEHVHRQEHFHHQIPHSVSFQARLKEGHNEILVRFEEVAARECPYAMALQLVGVAKESFVFIPTLHEGVARRQTVETAIQAAYLDRDVFVRDDEITVHWPSDLAQSVDLTVRLQKLPAWIHSEGRPTVSAGFKLPMSAPFQLPDGRYEILLIPTLREYYEGNLRLERKIALTSTKNEYSQAPYGTIDERRAEALTDAAQRETNVFSEIAKMALGHWADVKSDVILQTIDGINQRADCSDFYLVGLLGMIHRYGGDPQFPESLKQPLEECVLNFKYWADEPGADSMWFWSENHQILFHACEILAGQLYPDRIFTNAGQTGQWHREKGERLALSWLQKRGAGGFSEWDSNCYFEEDLLALSHLADLAESQSVYDLSTVIMDKLFLTMAINSFKGAFGSTHGRTYTPHIKGARGEATSGASRLMWGMGAFNDKILATVSLACMSNYEFPKLIGDVAADLPEEMWNHERHAGKLEAWCDRMDGAWEVNKVTYKTPDYLLCSAQDYHPGESGVQQHVWQATMGPDAVVFVTHPSVLSEENSHRPGFWHGNVVLPRVAQWKDVLIAVHKIPKDDWLGFTHAYFPVWAFDEYTLSDSRRVSDGWAFARKGDGYLAITAARGLEFIQRGDNAFRELRSYGLENIWLCQMGRASLDGDFKSFQEKILALDVSYDGLSVRCATLRGETLEFGWQGDFKRNGQSEPLSGFKHYDNPYCVADLNSAQLEIHFGDQAMRLNFAA
ncbi:MAG: hypothetical protein HY782_26075 [Chloroflexi bacterium]|nr:hypothetical protein [Chloroflexota bacterium]